ncbi:MAG TPA: efflux RND transporter periplasmic adaptor subunit [Pirellulales bacterium]|jgi:RND family efflux transporter MFP subunit|nr:efflux RND transporter periplasmic adaptor subunit [Pirellulales bacterium]
MPRLRVVSDWLLTAACLAAISLGIGGCKRPEAKIVAPKPPEVLVAYPTEDTVTEFEEFTGRTMAIHTIEIRARVSGYLDRVFFKDGVDVAAAAPLFEIDPRPYRTEVERTSAAVEQAEARLERCARIEDRSRRLIPTGSVTEEGLDVAHFDREEAKAALDAAKASLDTAKLNLSFTTISSPIKGRISRRLVDPGNLVQADDTPLAVIVSVDPMYAYFDFDERTVLRLRRLMIDGVIPSTDQARMNVHLALADEDEFNITGYIDFFDNQVEATTGTLRVRAVIANANQLLSPGLFLRLRVPIGAAKQSLLVREEALGTDQGQRFVYVVNENDEIVYRRVKTGFLIAGRRVIESGLKPGERIVVTGLQRVRPGVKVVPKLAEKSDLAIARQ